MRNLLVIIALAALVTFPVLTTAQDEADPAAPAATPPVQDKQAGEAAKAAPKQAAEAVSKPTGEAVPKQAGPELDTYQKKRSYHMGLQWGLNVRRGGVTVDVRSLIAGVFHAFTDQRLLTNKELAEVQTKFAKEMKEHAAKLITRLHKLAEDNEAEGKAFLAGNALDKKVRTMDSGLQYTVLEKGEGAFPKASDTVIIHYRGSFTDGKEFANIGDGTFTVKLDAANTLPGWREGIRQMQVGGTHRMFIPPDLAFGSEVRLGRRVPPGKTVVLKSS